METLGVIGKSRNDYEDIEKYEPSANTELLKENDEPENEQL